MRCVTFRFLEINGTAAAPQFLIVSLSFKNTRPATFIARYFPKVKVRTRFLLNIKTVLPKFFGKLR